MTGGPLSTRTRRGSASACASVNTARGADATMKDNDDRTALDVALAAGDIQVIQGLQAEQRRLRTIELRQDVDNLPIRLRARTMRL